MASEAERIYAEAAQERLEVILDESKNQLNITNKGGIGVFIKWIVGIDSLNKDVKFEDPDCEDIAGNPDLIVSPNEEVYCDIPSSISSGDYDIYILTERGSLFRAEAPQLITLPITLELDPASIEIGRGDVISVMLWVKASQNYPGGTVYLVADASDCTADVPLVFPLGATAAYKFIKSVSLQGSIDLDPGKSERVLVTVSAKSPYAWLWNNYVKDSQCHIWFMAMNATGGVWAEAGLEVTAK